MPDTAAVNALLNATFDRAKELRRWPVSTYRLQFHSGFTFRDAVAIVPYLAALGITHVYASPYLAATAGSTHGYDVVDHNRLNPELGTADDYSAWLGAMRQHGLTHILDTVPNHVGVATNDNPWWNDVLEYGPASKFAAFFDIDWNPEARPELAGRVLVPTLGKPYGQAIDDGELQVSFDASAGQFCVNYFERRFPIAPSTYGDILAGIKETDGVVTVEIEPGAKAGDALKQRLADAVRQRPSLGSAIERRLAVLNGKAGDARSFDGLDRLLRKQHFRLADWHVAFDEINYRRFFDVNDLAAIAMEREDVFDAAHALILPKLASGDIAGLRIDHPDGLFDPATYFLLLQRRFLLTVAQAIYQQQQPNGDWKTMRLACVDRLKTFDGFGSGPERWPLFVSAEKILAMHEPLIDDWAVQGTSGYDYLVHLNSLFVDPAAAPKFDELWRRVTGDHTSYDQLAYQNKRKMLESSLASELQALAHRLDRLARGDRRSLDFTFRTLQTAIRETIASFGVYRTYITADGVTDTDRSQIAAAIESAADRNPLTPRGAFAFLREVLLQNFSAESDDATREQQLAFAGKFQQLTSPVTAKGIEDTTFYQFNRFLALNEVGGEPAVFGIEPEQLHTFFAARQRDWPFALSTLSTHDTKRSEDVRGRLTALSDMPARWAKAVQEWVEVNRPLRQEHEDGTTSPAADEELLIYQTLVGAWPIDGQSADNFAERVQAYVLKAIREAKLRTRWGEPNPQHEEAVKAFIDGLLDPKRSAAFHQSLMPMIRSATHFGFINSLSQTLIKLVSPGIPDTYQGTELWDFSLVDPDNRRPVDYRLRERSLKEVDLTPASKLLDSAADGRLKLKLTSSVLRLRRDNAAFFQQADYRSLTFAGQHANHAFGFIRSWQGQSVAVVVPLRAAQWVDDQAWPVGDVWTDTRAADLPALRWRDVFTDQPVSGDKLATLFGSLPFVMLWGE